MALIDLHVDLTQAARALERIADALERISPPRVSGPRRPAQFLNISPADIADAEAEAERRKVAGTEGT